MPGITGLLSYSVSSCIQGVVYSARLLTAFKQMNINIDESYKEEIHCIIYFYISDFVLHCALQFWWCRRKEPPGLRSVTGRVGAFSLVAALIPPVSSDGAECRGLHTSYLFPPGRLRLTVTRKDTTRFVRGRRISIWCSSGCIKGKVLSCEGRTGGHFLLWLRSGRSGQCYWQIIFLPYPATFHYELDL